MRVDVRWGIGTIEPPPDGGVAVWLTAPSPEHEDEVDALLSEPERERRAAFQHLGTRSQFLTGRWLLRRVVGWLTGVPGWAVAVREGPRGALEVDDFHVNLSHTDGLVALALARMPVGVDVEDTQRVGRTVELADRFFAASEAAALRALPKAAQRVRFFELWTLKEAYIKARGEGLAIPLASFAFDLDKEPLGFVTDTEPDPGRWEFVRLEPTSRHRLAVARARW